jgi:hypothetical protein
MPRRIEWNLGVHGSCLFEHSLLDVDRENHSSAGKIRVHFKDRAKLFERLIILPRVVQHHAAIGSNDERQRVQLPGALNPHESLVESAPPGQMLGIPMMAVA